MYYRTCGATVWLILAFAAAAIAQGSARAVPLEAADCSRHHSTFGRYEVAQAVQHVEVPLTSATLDVQPSANGGVAIEKGAGPGYSITACVTAGAPTFDAALRAAEAVRLTVEGNRVRVVNPGSADRWNVQLIVEAPAGARISVETANGPISVIGVDGIVTARATNGPIAVEDVTGRVDAVAANGPISVSGSRGTFDLETRNGPISVHLEGTRWDGELHARALNGPLTLRVPRDYASGVEVSSSGGSPWNCRATACGGWARDGGARTLRLGRDPIVVRLSTRNGPVTIDDGR